MPRQKLPKGWRYDSYGNAESDTRNNEGDCEQWFELYQGQSVGTKTFEPDVPVAVALAVIRNAGQDRVYNAVKALFDDEWPNVGNRLTKLKELIASLEEPE